MQSITVCACQRFSAILPCGEDYSAPKPNRYFKPGLMRLSGFFFALNKLLQLDTSVFFSLNQTVVA